MSKARRLKTLENENAKLKKLLAEATPPVCGWVCKVQLNPYLLPENTDNLSQCADIGNVAIGTEEVRLHQALQGTREQNKLRIRQDITEAAFQLFLDRGFDDTTVEDIVALAGVSRRTFYRYFGSAQEVLSSWDSVVGRRLYEAVLARPTDERPLHAARNALRHVLAFYEIEQERSMAAIRLLYRSLRSQSRFAELFAQWIDGLNQGLLDRAGPNASPLACSVSVEIVVGIAKAATEQWAKQGADVDFIALLDRAFECADSLYTENLLTLLANNPPLPKT